MDFIEAEYVAPAGGPGRTKGPNPFTDVIAAIALQKDDKDKPVARAFTFEHTDRNAEDSNLRKLVSGYKRQLSEAGADNDPAVTVMSVVNPVTVTVKGKPQESAIASKLTFWTVPRQTRKPNGANGTTSSEQSVAVTA